MKDLYNEKNSSILDGPNNIDQIISQSGDVFNDTTRLLQHAYNLEKAGFRSQAEIYYNKILELTEDLHRENPTLCSGYTFAKIALNHGKELFNFGRIEDAKKAFIRATDLLTASITQGVSLHLIEVLAENLHWLARCQRKTGDFQGAQESYSKSIPLLRNLLLFRLSPERLGKLQVMFNTAVFGYSKLRCQSHSILSQIH